MCISVALLLADKDVRTVGYRDSNDNSDDRDRNSYIRYRAATEGSFRLFDNQLFQIHLIYGSSNVEGWNPKSSTCLAPTEMTIASTCPPFAQY